MEKIDYEYHVTKAQIRQYQKMPILARLQWVEDMCILTNMMRAAPIAPTRVRLKPAAKTRRTPSPR